MGKVKSKVGRIKINKFKLKVKLILKTKVITLIKLSKLGLLLITLRLNITKQDKY